MTKRGPFPTVTVFPNPDAEFENKKQVGHTKKNNTKYHTRQLIISIADVLNQLIRRLGVDAGTESVAWRILLQQM
jgi:hypothetical protein